ncbi:hypothetical protein F52700_8055 [Fusarium sp. NRRL 52700]|nr:hypothetical protein F52700_8055 [Fusarium sp. NRRL 52700]
MSNTNTNLPTPEINAATSYDFGSQQLNLFITYPSTVSVWPNDVIVNLIPYQSTTPIKYGNGSPVFPANSNTGTMVMPLPLATASQAPKITVASLDASWDSSSPSGPWEIPARNLGPLTSPASINFTSLGSLEVTWTWIAGAGATAQQVALIIAGQPPIKTIVANTSPTGTATFTIAQANNLFTPGASVTIQCTAISLGLWYAPVVTPFSIPQSSQMMPYSFNKSPPISSNCTMASLPLQEATPVQAFWGTLEGAIESVLFPNREPWTFAKASTISDTGSCLTSISVSYTNQQLWWITETGAIDGQIMSGNGWASPATGATPFNKPNTASTVNGGSMTSLILEGNTGAILFWVDPQGAIACCTWLVSSGWQAVYDALPRGTASATTQLSVLSVGSIVYLFCVSPSGALVGGQWSSVSGGNLGAMWQFSVPSSGNALPGGGLASLSVSAQEVAVVWTTANNSLEMSLIYWPESPQNIHLPLTAPQSVLGGTGIAAYSMAANQCSIWWIGQSSDLRRTNVDLTKLGVTSTPDWPVFEDLGPGSCKQMRSLIVQKASATQIYLLYASANGTIAGLCYGS